MLTQLSLISPKQSPPWKIAISSTRLGEMTDGKVWPLLPTYRIYFWHSSQRRFHWWLRTTYITRPSIVSRTDGFRESWYSPRDALCKTFDASPYWCVRWNMTKGNAKESYLGINVEVGVHFGGAYWLKFYAAPGGLFGYRLPELVQLWCLEWFRSRHW